MKSHNALRFRAWLLLMTACAAAPVRAGVLPLQDNRWDNPAFVAAFTGTYGFDTERNPSITSEEKTLFETLTPLIAAQPDQAVAMLAAAIKPESSGALDYTLANLHFQAGRAPEAITAYRAALKKFPGFVRARRNLGMLYVQQGQFAEALPELQQAAAGGFDSTILGLIGFCYLNLGKTASALDAYRLALVFEPASRDWRLGKAQCLLLVGENKEGIALVEEMLADQPGESTLLLLQANAFLADGQPDKAAANIQIVRGLGKASAESLVLLGDIFVNQGNTAVAVDAYLAALEAGKLTAERELHLVRALAARSAWAEADAVLARIRAKSPAGADGAHALELMNLEAQVALARDDDDRAAQILEGVVAKDPLNGRAILLLADYHAKQGEIDRAELYYDRAARVTETAPEALIQHARLLVSRRDFARAAKLLAEAQQLRPQAHVATYLAKVEAAAQAVR